ncbi:ABC transporter permease [Paenibacillus barengoltzii]|uniref:ABC transport system permease protein n=1 Tax=Paenibacillus barengoltzii J12 TaxID=935846 RepID=A0ABY1LZP8_9BACL|nr:ABC transporter permease [Paenibacillus barengoltzii]SMF42416.1 putative ABC transport system permease protein [Paenibacillus barengoltzii J12]
MTFRQFAYNNVLRNKRTYAAYFLSSAFSVMIFFVCALFLFHPGLQQEVMYRSAVLVLWSAEVIMYVFVFFFVIYSVGSFLRSRKREFGILLLHGMTEKQLRNLVFLEHLLIGAGALVCGIGGGLLLAKLFLMAGSNLLGVPQLSFHVPWQGLLLTLGAFSLLFLIISLCTTMLLGSHRLIELFQAEMKPASPPQASLILSLLGAGLLGISYGLAATATASNVLTRMLPVTAMTIAGTYFFYTQLSVFLIQRIKRQLDYYWNKTNLITVSSLAYRMKENARMFFLVTIISTVTFCAVGAFASVNRLADQFEQDYPVDIAYVAKGDSEAEDEHLEAIRSELGSRGIAYRTLSLPIILAEVVSSSSSNTLDRLPLISFTDYKRLLEAAGIAVSESSPKDGEALLLLGSERERPQLLQRKPVSYTFAGAPELTVHEIGISQHVALPENLTPTTGDDREGSFSGLVVSDPLLERLKAASAEEGEGLGMDRFTGFYVDALETTRGLAAELTDNGRVSYESDQPYAMTVSGTLAEVQRTTYRALLFFALLVGTVFFIAAGSFLYFRLYSDLAYDRRQYGALSKLGLTDKELARIITRQVGVLFFVPIALAIVHSLFAFKAMQSLFNFSVAWQTVLILASFLLVQVVYFFFIQARYLRNVKKAIR